MRLGMAALLIAGSAGLAGCAAVPGGGGVAGTAGMAMATTRFRARSTVMEVHLMLVCQPFRAVDTPLALAGIAAVTGTGGSERGETAAHTRSRRNGNYRISGTPCSFVNRHCRTRPPTKGKCKRIP